MFNIAKIKTGLMQKKPDKKHLSMCLAAITALFFATTYISGVIGQFAQAYNKYLKDNGLFYNTQKTPMWPNMQPIYCIKYSLTAYYGQQTLKIILILGAIFLLYMAFQNRKKKTMDDRNFQQSSNGTYGTSGWIENPEEIFDVLPVKETKGNILGSINKNGKEYIVSFPTDTHYNKNIAIFGAPGVGKTTCFVYNQMIQCAKRGESVIVTDTKGEIYANTSQYMRNNGYNVKIFNLVNPQFSDSWNCLNEVSKGDDSERQMNAQIFVNTIMENTSTGKTDQFWGNGEMNFLKAFVLYTVLHEKPEDQNIPHMYDMMLSKNDTDIAKLFDKLSKNDPAKMAYNLYLKAAGNDKVASGIQMGVGIRLQVFQIDSIRKITSSNEIDLTLPAKEKCAYYLRISDQDSTCQFLSSLFFSFLFIDIIRYADTYGEKGKCKVPVDLVLDEFTNIGIISDFTKKLSTVRSRDVAISMIFQSLPQLRNRYPQDMWKEILGDCDTQLFLGGTDDDTCKYISALSGDLTIVVSSEAKKLASIRATDYTPDYKQTSSVGKRMLLTPDEVRRLPNDYALIILRCQKFMKVNKYKYDKNPESKEFKLVNVRDHVPEWKLLENKKNEEKKKAITTQTQTDAKTQPEKQFQPKAKLTEQQAVNNTNTTNELANNLANSSKNTSSQENEQISFNLPGPSSPRKVQKKAKKYDPTQIIMENGKLINKSTGEILEEKDISKI